MGLFAKIALGVLVAAGIGYGAWKNVETKNQLEENSAMNQADVSAQVNLSVGNTSADLDADLKAIDSQLNVISNTSADIDQSMNDTSTIE